MGKNFVTGGTFTKFYFKLLFSYKNLKPENFTINHVRLKHFFEYNKSELYSDPCSNFQNLKKCVVTDGTL
jgi:hypothetical protein